MRKIIIHYHRADQDYQPWGVWLWPQGHEGRWVTFTGEDHYGKIAVCEVPKKHQSVGFLIRGASWEKDIDHDRYIENFIGNKGEIWLVAGDPYVYLAPPAHLRQDVRAFDTLELTVHYYRYDEDYSGWNLWLWGDQELGRVVEFVSEDHYGYLARTTFQQQTDGAEVGFVLRRSALGNPWLEKDGQDRQLPFYRADNNGKLEIWLMQDDPRIYFKACDVDRQPRLTRAFLNDLHSIAVETYLPVQGDLGELWGFSLSCQDTLIELAQVYPCNRHGHNPRQFVLKTKNALDLEKEYLLKHLTHKTIPLSFGQVFSSSAFQEKFHYEGNDLGVTYTPTETTFKVWAPTAKDLQLVVYAKGQGGDGESIPLQQGERGVWSVSLRKDLEGVYYNFLVTHGEKTCEVVDPYARSTGVNGERGQVVDLEKTNPTDWEKVAWIPLEDPVDAVLYEVHVRDFSSSSNSGIKAQGQYLGLVERKTMTPGGISTGLDHLKDLGVTHLHLLPIFDFATVDESNPQQAYNWGYDPLNYNVPEGSYSSNPYDGRVRIYELKKLIRDLNRADLGVIMDVVYNHTFKSIASNLNKLVPGYYYRLNPNGTFSNGSGCGNELADERSMVRKFIVDSVLYWAKEYKLAGFRFDLMGLHHVATMQAVRRALDQIQPQILIYGEGWAAAKSTLAEHKRAIKENTPLLAGIASFCNDFRDGVKGHVFHTREPGFIQNGSLVETVKFGIVGAIEHPHIDYSQVLYSHKPWALEPSQSVLYVEAHDNLTLWDKLLCTTSEDMVQARVQMMKLAHALVLTSQGIPFLHSGQEFARSKGGDPNSYQSPDHVNQLDWERKEEFSELYKYTRSLIRLRQQCSAFRMRSSAEIREKLRFLYCASPNTLAYSLGPHANNDSYETILVFFNSNHTAVQVEIGPGSWEILANHQGAACDLGFVAGPLTLVEARSPLILGRRGRKW